MTVRNNGFIESRGDASIPNDVDLAGGPRWRP
jgi:hypothetical protein